MPSSITSKDRGVKLGEDGCEGGCEVCGIKLGQGLEEASPQVSLPQPYLPILKCSDNTLCPLVAGKL